ncbi:ribosome small subunit-dependent GTPase A [Bacteroidetes/Chlorobi group bacterium Naka2016]|jgi:ribosome biogenesis GTPase|nr:MAG: ribosome small subunit-dependent GTPase A [Bacteroidetes/Chlorobi group bacterium Naka2016]
MEELEKFGEDFVSPEIKKTKKRVLLKKQKITSVESFKGIVVTTKGRFFFVKKQSGSDDNLYRCVTSGSMEVNHPHSSLVTVGDRCEFVLSRKDANGLELGRIIKVEERKTFLMRKSIIGNKEDVIASNMDQAVIMLAADNPPYNLRMLDKILVSCEFGGVESIICINKIDIADKEKVYADFEIYQKLGYEILFISALNSIGTDKVYNILKGKETLFLGVSGVGKSTLVNSLFGKEIQKVGRLAKNLRGKHTTTSCYYLNLDENTVIIDSPGFREFEIFGVSREELPFYFRDFEPYFQKCKFQPCSHIHEPQCAVKNALKRGKISSERYFSYLSIYESI